MQITEITVTCSRCGKEQSAREFCVNCDKHLPEIKIVEVEVIREVLVDKVIFRDREVPLVEQVVIGAICPLCHEANKFENIEYAGRVETFAETEEKSIRKALAICPNPIKAAKMLGIGKTTLYRRVKDLGIPLKKGEPGNGISVKSGGS